MQNAVFVILIKLLDCAVLIIIITIPLCNFCYRCKNLFFIIVIIYQRERLSVTGEQQIIGRFLDHRQVGAPFLKHILQRLCINRRAHRGSVRRPYPDISVSMSVINDKIILIICQSFKLIRISSFEFPHKLRIFVIAYCVKSCAADNVRFAIKTYRNIFAVHRGDIILVFKNHGIRRIRFYKQLFIIRVFRIPVAYIRYCGLVFRDNEITCVLVNLNIINSVFRIHRLFVSVHIA